MIMASFLRHQRRLAEPKRTILLLTCGSNTEKMEGTESAEEK